MTKGAKNREAPGGSKISPPPKQRSDTHSQRSVQKEAGDATGLTTMHSVSCIPDSNGMLPEAESRPSHNIASKEQIATAQTDEFKTWLHQRRFSHTEFSIEQLSATVLEKQISVTVIVPCKEVASTIAGVIIHTVGPLVEAKVVTRVVVVDAASKDGTAQVAKAHGAQVIQQSGRGKGDALWAGLLATTGDIVAFLDGDTADPALSHLLGILGPLILYDDISMVRACFDRPFKSANGEITANEGGRVTECLARPLLNMYWPSLSGFRQPLAGEFAARRQLWERLPFPVGYGVEIGTLVDSYNLVGINGLAEVDVGQRQNAHKPLRELTKMAQAILSTAEKRLDRGSAISGRIFLPWENDFHNVDTTELPPLQEYRKQISMYPSPPFVIIDGVRMFRDIGGDPTQTKLRPGLIYRSGELCKITQRGAFEFGKLNIEKIFDFRSPVEVSSPYSVHGVDDNFDRNAIGTAYEQLLQEGRVERVAVPVFRDEDWLPEKQETRLKQYADAAQGYAKAYKYTLVCGASAFRPVFLHLAQASPSPILLHCTAGKDRTGVAAMLVLLLVGSDAAAISKEYALNNLDSNREWGTSATNRILRQPGMSGNVEAVANVVQAREEYMLATIDMFGREFGSAERYMKEYLRLDEEMISKIKANLVAS